MQFRDSFNSAKQRKLLIKASKRFVGKIKSFFNRHSPGFRPLKFFLVHWKTQSIALKCTQRSASNNRATLRLTQEHSNAQVNSLVQIKEHLASND